MALGSYNDPLYLGGSTTLSASSPIFIVGNGSGGLIPTLQNAFSILYDGTISFQNYTFPVADGMSGQVLGTDGAGQLGWQAQPIIFERYGSTIRQASGYSTDHFLFAMDTIPNPNANISSGFFYLRDKGSFRGGSNSFVSLSKWYYDNVGSNLFAYGVNTMAIGNASIALGRGTSSAYDDCVALGSYNDPLYLGRSTTLSDSSPIFIVGNGSGGLIPTLQNAFSILYNGTIPFQNYSFPISDGADGQVLKTDGSGNLGWENELWNLSGTDVYRVGGQVGIGTNDPDIKLHLVHANNSSNSGMKIENSSNGNYWRLYTRSGADELALYNYDGSSEVLAADLTRAGVLSPSDRRLKKHIHSLPYSKEDILQLQPKSYFFKNDSEKKQCLGFIAQDVQKIFPELVRYSTDDDLYLMNYAGFGVLAIQAIKEQQMKINTLRQVNQEITDRVQRLEKLIGQLMKGN